MKKISVAFVVFTALTAFFISCKKEEKTVTPASTEDIITNFTVNFFNPADTITEIGVYSDPDGPGPQAANIGGVSLKANTYYEVTFMIEDGSKNQNNPVDIHKKIKTNGKDYKLCIDNILGMTITAKDSDGSLPIGLVNDLMTSSTTGTDKFNFSIKYQKGVKDGQCSPGTLYYSCKIPVSVY